MTIPTGTKIFCEGESPSKAFMLERGCGRISLVSKTGRKILLRTASPGSLLGLSAIITGVPYETTVEALTPAQGFFIDRHELMRFLESHAKEAFEVVEVLSDLLTQVLDRYRCLC